MSPSSVRGHCAHQVCRVGVPIERAVSGPIVHVASVPHEVDGVPIVHVGLVSPSSVWGQCPHCACGVGAHLLHVRVSAGSPGVLAGQPRCQAGAGLEEAFAVLAGQCMGRTGGITVVWG